MGPETSSATDFISKLQSLVKTREEGKPERSTRSSVGAHLVDGWARGEIFFPLGVYVFGGQQIALFGASECSAFTKTADLNGLRSREHRSEARAPKSWPATGGKSLGAATRAARRLRPGWNAM